MYITMGKGHYKTSRSLLAIINSAADLLISWSSKHKGYSPCLGFSNTTSLVDTKCQLNRGLVLLWLFQHLTQAELQLIHLCCQLVQIPLLHTRLMINVSARVFLQKDHYLQKNVEKQWAKGTKHGVVIPSPVMGKKNCGQQQSPKFISHILNKCICLEVLLKSPQENRDQCYW